MEINRAVALCRRARFHRYARGVRNAPCHNRYAATNASNNSSSNTTHGKCVGTMRRQHRLPVSAHAMRDVREGRACTWSLAPRGTEHNIFTPMDLIYGRHSLERGSDIGFPECLACCGVEGANFAIARSREDQAAAVTTGPTFGKCEPVFLNPFAANSGTSPTFTCHLMCPLSYRRYA